MPFLDRYWWLRIPIALLPLGAAIFIVAYVLRDLSGAMHDLLLGIGCTGVGALVLLVFAYFFMRRIGHARDRSGRRRAAIAGNRDAITIAEGADILAETALPRVPFTVAFPLTRWDQPELARLRVVLSVPLFAIVLVLTSVLDSRRGLAVPLAISYVLFFVLAGVTHLWRGIVIRPYVRTYRSPRNIIADTMGLLWQPIVGRERAIRWDEMRLLEVERFNATPFTSDQTIMRRRYTLYTRNSAIWWTDPGNLHLPPSGPYAQLLALIKANASLEPRTFDDDLFVPVVRQTLAELPASVPSLEAYVSYLLAFPLPTRRGRLIAGFFGVLLTALAALAGIWTLSKFGVFTLPPLMRIATSWLHAILALLLLLGGLIGLPLLIGVLLATPARRLRRKGGIRADHVGISDYPSRTGSAIAWSDIADIQCETLGTAKAYIVHNAVSDTTITWPDIPGDRYPPPALVTALGFTPISSDELVALVMRMTGKPLTSRDPQPSIPGAAHAVS